MTETLDTNLNVLHSASLPPLPVMNIIERNYLANETNPVESIASWRTSQASNTVTMSHTNPDP
jgi:hypothetical protein